MRPHLSTLSAILIAAFAISAAPAAKPLVFPGEAKILDAGQRAALAAWITERGNVRLADLEDCDCDDDLEYVQQVGIWSKPIPGFEPHYAVGDFNGDGKTDFAAVLVVTAGPDEYGGEVVIFNGPVTAQSRPAFIGKVEPVEDQALVQEPGKPLMIRPFESEGCALRPMGNSYVEECK